MSGSERPNSDQPRSLSPEQQAALEALRSELPEHSRPSGQESLRFQANDNVRFSNQNYRVGGQLPGGLIVLPEAAPNAQLPAELRPGYQVFQNRINAIVQNAGGRLPAGSLSSYDMTGALSGQFGLPECGPNERLLAFRRTGRNGDNSFRILRFTLGTEGQANQWHVEGILTQAHQLERLPATGAAGELPRPASRPNPEEQGRPRPAVRIHGQEIGPNRYVEIGRRADISVPPNPQRPNDLADRHIAIRTDGNGNAEMLVLAPNAQVDIEHAGGGHRTVRSSDGWVRLTPGSSGSGEATTGDSIAFGGLRHEPLSRSAQQVASIGLTIPADGLVVGRNPSSNEIAPLPGNLQNADLHEIPEATSGVSRRHAYFSQTSDGLHVADLNSRYGVFIQRPGEAQPIQVPRTPEGQAPILRRLQAGDIVWLGRSQGGPLPDRTFRVEPVTAAQPGVDRAQIHGLRPEHLVGSGQVNWNVGDTPYAVHQNNNVRVLATDSERGRVFIGSATNNDAVPALNAAERQGTLLTRVQWEGLNLQPGLGLRSDDVGNAYRVRNGANGQVEVIRLTGVRAVPSTELSLPVADDRFRFQHDWARDNRPMPELQVGQARTDRQGNSGTICSIDHFDGGVVMQLNNRTPMPNTRPLITERREALLPHLQRIDAGQNNGQLFFRDNNNNIYAQNAANPNQLFLRDDLKYSRVREPLLSGDLPRFNTYGRPWESGGAPPELPSLAPGAQYDNVHTVAGRFMGNDGTTRLILRDTRTTSQQVTLGQRVELGANGRPNSQDWQQLPAEIRGERDLYLHLPSNQIYSHAEPGFFLLSNEFSSLTAEMNHARRQSVHSPNFDAQTQEISRRSERSRIIGERANLPSGTWEAVRLDGNGEKVLIMNTAPTENQATRTQPLAHDTGDLLANGRINTRRYDLISLPLSADPRYPDAALYRDRRAGQNNQIYMIYTDAQNRLQRVERPDMRIMSFHEFDRLALDERARQERLAPPSLERVPMASPEIVQGFSRSGWERCQQIQRGLQDGSLTAQQATERFNDFVQNHLRQAETNTRQTTRVRFNFENGDQHLRRIEFVYTAPGSQNERRADIELTNGRAQFVDAQTRRPIPENLIVHNMTMSLDALRNNPAQVLHDSFVEIVEASRRDFADMHHQQATAGFNRGIRQEVSQRFHDTFLEQTGLRVVDEQTAHQRWLQDLLTFDPFQSERPAEQRPRLRGLEGSASDNLVFTGDRARTSGNAAPRVLTTAELLQRLDRSIEEARAANRPDELRFYETLKENCRNANEAQRPAALFSLSEMYNNHGVPSAELCRRMAADFDARAARARTEGRTADADFLIALRDGFTNNNSAERRSTMEFLSSICGGRGRAIAIGAGVLALVTAGTGLYMYSRYRNTPVRSVAPAPISGSR